MGIRGAIVTIATLSMYVTTVIGIGRYSCHCEHASSITFLGISSKCNCTHEEHHHDPGNCCPGCGHHLVTKSVKKDDCCAVKFYMLDSDQNQSGGQMQISPEISSQILPPEPQALSFVLVSIPQIKTFQALFRVVTGPLYYKHRQLIL